MCYKLIYSYTLCNQTTNQIIKLNTKSQYVDDLYQDALDYSKNYNDDIFKLFVQIKNEPCWKSELICYQNYINTTKYEYGETEYDYEEVGEIKSGEWLDEF